MGRHRDQPGDNSGKISDKIILNSLVAMVHSNFCSKYQRLKSSPFGLMDHSPTYCTKFPDKPIYYLPIFPYLLPIFHHLGPLADSDPLQTWF
jgi:hypothetical protein